MAAFIIKINNKDVIGKTQADSEGNIESTAKCPSCGSKFSSKKKKGQSRTVEYMESSVRSMLKRHYDKKHKE